MEELQVPSKFMLAISYIYRKAIFQLYMGGEIYKFLVSTSRVKQGFILSPTLFGLCIDQFLEEIIIESMQ